MKLAISGHMRMVARWTEWCEYARKQAAEILRDHPRVKQLRITFCGPDPDWNYGFSRLVRYDQVEIVVPSRFRTPRQVKWLILHELHHARQILEKRLNKDLGKITFTNRLSNTKTFAFRRGYDWDRYGQYFCVETGKFVIDEPWGKGSKR